MIISYAPIHHVEEFDGQKAHDTARAQKITDAADRHGIFTRLKADGDTSYLEAPVSLESLALSKDDTPLLTNPLDRQKYNDYVEFLADLEESGIGYLLHEVNTDREKAVLEVLLPGGSDPRTILEVDVEYRISYEASET